MNDFGIRGLNPADSRSGGFIGQTRAYFRDFLDTDFRQQSMLKRRIGLKDGCLTGIAISKYPELVADIWKTLGNANPPAGYHLRRTPRASRRSTIPTVMTATTSSRFDRT